MSYARWSSDDWKSDVYVYQATNGQFYCHVACSRYVFPQEMPPLDWSSPERLQETYEQRQRILEQKRVVPINGPYDGRDFVTKTRREMVQILKMLRAAGYHVPEHAIQALEEEIAEGWP